MDIKAPNVTDKKGIYLFHCANVHVFIYQLIRFK